MTKEELIRYVAERFSAEPEYPWADENFIFRHPSNRKWFAVAMRVACRRLGLEREGAADIVDVNSSLETAPGVKSVERLDALLAQLADSPT